MFFYFTNTLVRLKLDLRLLFILVSLGFTLQVNGQSSSSIYFTWNSQVYCSNWNEDPKDRAFTLEQIDDAPCIQLCENSSVVYQLDGVPSSASVSWNASGGIITSQTSTTGGSGYTSFYCEVAWNFVGNGGLSFTISDSGSTITKTICLETVIKPTANFEIIGGQDEVPYRTCQNQTLNFINLSTDNNGSPLTNFYWVILNNSTGQTTYYNTFEPSHVFTEDGEYTVSLTAYNSCWCSDIYKEDIIVKEKGFDIYCPNVICENQKEIYSLPFNGMDLCQDNFNWIVQGGDIVNQGGGNVEVLWNAVDENGFGYVTFDPSGCDVECYIPTTIKIPVLLQNGTIFGNTEICIGDQEIFSLPQWPTTDFQWEIVGDPNNATGQLFLTDQRNEIALQPDGSMSTIVLRCIYNNTLLNCGGVAEITINVKQGLEIQGEEFICQNSQGIFTNSQNISGTWQLFNIAGSQIYSSTGATLNYTFNTLGDFLVKFQHPDFCESNFWVKVVNKPTAPSIIGSETEYCPNLSYLFEIDNPVANYSYQWNVDGGTFDNGNVGTQVLVTFNSGANPVVSARAVSSNPTICYSNYTILPINLRQINAEINGNITVCPSTTEDYTLNVPSTSNLFTDYDEVVWSLSDPVLGSVSSGQNTSEVTITWNNAGSYTSVNLIATVHYCNETVAIIYPVTIQAATEIEITADQDPVCNDEDVTFTVSAVSGSSLPVNYQIEWNINGSVVTNSSLTYTTSFTNVGTGNITQNISAKVKNTDCNAFSNIATVNIAVQPGPVASISLTSSNGNAFCDPASIDVTFTVSMPTGCTVEWFKKGPPVAIVGGNTSDFDVIGASPGFGTYYAIVTDTATGCTTKTNELHISQICADPQECTVLPVPVVTNSSYNDCGVLHLDNYFSYAPTQWYFNIIGPENHLNYTAPTITLPTGSYKVILYANYLCQEGGVATYTRVIDVVIPYVPDFTYLETCNNNNSFDITFNDITSYYATVTNVQATFSYKTALSTTYIPVPGTTVTLPQGFYDFQLTVTGDIDGVTQPLCTKTINGIALSAIGSYNIEVDDIYCHNTPIKFNLDPTPNGLSLLWDFDDDGATNSLAEPYRVFTTSGTHNVGVTITNNVGCEVYYTVPVIIPEPCFNGTLTSNPSPATVCLGGSVVLTYQPDSTDYCTVQTYQWMRGDTLLNTTTTPSFTVNQSGLYWVKVISDDNCSYSTEKVEVKVVPPPSISINGPSTFCEGEVPHFEITTSTTNIQWYLNGNLLTAFTNLSEIDLSGLPVGTYELEVMTQQATCSNSKLHTFEIVPLPNITIGYEVLNCDPYEVSLFVNGVPANYQVNWSNGMSGSDIIVYFGGVYRAVVFNGFCEVEVEIYVPKRAEEFLWIFPEGCYDNCKIEDKNNMIIGPLGQFDSWSWNYNNNPDVYGSGQVQPYFVTQEGTYTLTLGNDPCKEESAPLHFSTYECDHCKFEMNTHIEVKPADLPYCAYDFTISIYSSYPYPLNATLSDYYGNSIIQPAGITIQPGGGSPNVFTFTVIPVSPFTGGTTTLWELQATYTDIETGEQFSCTNQFEVFIPDCYGEGGNTVIYQERMAQNKTKTFAVEVYPNPTTHQVTFQYKDLPANSDLYLYDQAGRLLQQVVLSGVSGNTSLSLKTALPGWYIAVIKQEGVFVAQHKIIKINH